MGYIVLSKQQVEGQLNVKLCKDKASADSYRKQLIKQYHDVVILSKGDHKLVTSKLFKAWVNGEDNDGGDDTHSDKHNEIYKHNYGGDEEAHKAWDKEGEGKVLENTFINAFGDENEDLTPQCFHADEDGDEYYLSSNGNRYYLFKKMVTLKGDLARTWYMFGKKEWSRTNDLTLLRFYNIPYDKCVVENKSGYPFLKTEVTLNEEIKQKTPTWDL
mgnify:CR=1 FL=1